MWFHKGTPALCSALVLWMLHFSHFFTCFLYGCYRLHSCANACLSSFVHCLWKLIVWLTNWNFNGNYNFFDEKHPSWWLWNFKILWGSPIPDPTKKRSNILLLVQSVTLFQPVGFFIFYWNPCINAWITSLGTILFQNRVKEKMISVASSRKELKNAAEHGVL